MEDITNILISGDDLNEGQLLQYIQGNASGEDLHTVEQQMAESDFVNDAVEGLQEFESPKKLGNYVNQLNKKLRRQLGVKKQLKEKREIKHLGWIIFAVILVIVLCVLGFVVVHALDPALHPRTAGYSGRD